MKRITVISPVYSEQDAIERFHNRLVEALRPLSDRYEFKILYVLDKSPDKTEEILRRISLEDDNVATLVLSRRFGHQASLIAGIDYSQGDATIMLDSDLQHPPELIAEMLIRYEQGADIVQMVRSDSGQVGRLRRLTGRWFYRMLASISSLALPPGSADFRLMSQRVCGVFKRQIREQNQFLRGLVGWVGFNVCYLRFECHKREYGRTNYRLSTLLNFAVHGVCSFSKAPLRFCALTGVMLALVSILVALGEVVAYFFGDVDVPGWASLMAGLTFLGGLQLFFLGVVGEYISLIFDEVKGRPLYLVDRIHGRSPVQAAAYRHGDPAPMSGGSPLDVMKGK